MKWEGPPGTCGGGFRATLHLGVVRLLYESGHLGGEADVRVFLRKSFGFIHRPLSI